jgi:hypothetical protein
MDTSTLDIYVLQTYDVKTLAVLDNSVYAPPIVNPTIEITPPAFNSIAIPFIPDTYNIFNSEMLGISPVGSPVQPLPDGVYQLRYSIAPTLTSYVSKSFMRTDAIQEKFDTAFMTSELMECDNKLKEQAKLQLDTIYFLIQGSIAAANNCAITESEQLYSKASAMLDRFISKGCRC